jgi:DNA-damage-inducible protein J
LVDLVAIFDMLPLSEGGLPIGLTMDPAIHDAWFRAKVKEAIEDTRAVIPQDQVEDRFDVTLS